jgi:hypothetical protein
VYESVKEVQRKPVIETSSRTAREHDRDRDKDREKPLKDKDIQSEIGSSTVPKLDNSEHVKKTPSPK